MSTNLAAATTHATRTQPRTLRIDPSRSQVAFWVRFLGPVSVHGLLAGIDGRITLDDTEPERSTVRATVDVATLDTGITRRDHHLRSADFFDVGRYPLASFESDSVESLANGQWRVHGLLDLHGVRRPVALDTISAEMGDGEMRLTATIGLSRRDFGIGKDDLLTRLMLGDRVHLELTIAAKP
ncbi:MAG TPA: YceI family protein [Dehalococcoidia bacterium]|nr:YceI family protein [Dehalococcoidia bacterium]